LSLPELFRVNRVPVVEKQHLNSASGPYSGGVVDRVFRAAVREHLVLTGCVSPNSAIYSFTNDDVWDLSHLDVQIRLPQQTNYSTCVYKLSQYAIISDIRQCQQGETRFSSATKIASTRDFRCIPRATDNLTSLMYVAVNIRQNYSACTEFTYSRF